MLHLNPRFLPTDNSSGKQNNAGQAGGHLTILTARTGSAFERQRSKLGSPESSSLFGNENNAKNRSFRDSCPGRCVCRAGVELACSCAKLGTARQLSTEQRNQNPSGTAEATSQMRRPIDRTTAQVRKAIIADKDLSTYAHNVKIITKDGTVTLKGPVKSGR